MRHRGVRQRVEPRGVGRIRQADRPRTAEARAPRDHGGGVERGRRGGRAHRRGVHDAAALTPCSRARRPTCSAWGGTYFSRGGTETAPQSPYCATHGCAAVPSPEATTTFPATGWTAGGGFSAISPRPQFQAGAVEAFLAVSAGKVPPVFARSGRGYPDVSLIAHNFAVVVGGSFLDVDGTSASSPLMAGILARLNDARRARGQTALGLVAPFLYAAAAWCDGCLRRTASALDSNRCTEETCDGCVGYNASAEVDWDPVFGLGHPNVTALLAYDALLHARRQGQRGATCPLPSGWPPVHNTELHH